MWGIGSGTTIATITDGSDENFLFNTPSISLSGNGNTVFGAAGTISGNNNTLLNGTGHNISGSRNTVAGQNITTGNSQRAFAHGFGLTVGVSGAANNGFAVGNNNVIDNGANNSVLGSNLESKNYQNSVIIGQNNDPSVDSVQGKTSFQVGVGSGQTNRKNAINVTRVNAPLRSVIYMDQLATSAFDFPNDTDALAGGIEFGGLYHDKGVVRINVTP